VAGARQMIATVLEDRAEAMLKKGNYSLFSRKTLAALMMI
jgi:hypothetical protein